MQVAWRTVVGVVADVKNSGLAVNADPEFYLPWKNDPVESLSTAHVIAHTGADPRAMAAWMRAETVALDPTLPFTIETMSHLVASSPSGPGSLPVCCLFSLAFALFCPGFVFSAS